MPVIKAAAPLAALEAAFAYLKVKAFTGGSSTAAPNLIIIESFNDEVVPQHEGILYSCDFYLARAAFLQAYPPLISFASSSRPQLQVSLCTAPQAPADQLNVCGFMSCPRFSPTEGSTGFRATNFLLAPVLEAVETLTLGAAEVMAALSQVAMRLETVNSPILPILAEVWAHAETDNPQEYLETFVALFECKNMFLHEYYPEFMAMSEEVTAIVANK